MDYSFLAARLSFTFIYTCIFFSWQVNSAAAAAAAATVITCVCLCVCLSVRKRTYERGDGCRPNLVDMARSEHLEVIKC